MKRDRPERSSIHGSLIKEWLTLFSEVPLNTDGFNGAFKWSFDMFNSMEKQSDSLVAVETAKRHLPKDILANSLG